MFNIRIACSVRTFSHLETGLVWAAAEVKRTGCTYVTINGKRFDMMPEERDESAEDESFLRSRYPYGIE